MDLGIFYILAVSSLATYGILIAGFLFIPCFTNTNYKNSLSSTSKIYYKTNKILAGEALSNSSSRLSQYFNISTTKRFLHTSNNSSNSNKNNQDNNSSTYIGASYLDL